MPAVAAVLAGVIAGSLMALPQSPSVEEPRVERGGSNGTNIETVVTRPGVAAGGSAAASGGGAGRTMDGRPAASAGVAPACTYTPLSAEEALAAGLLSPDDGGPDNVQRQDGAYVRRDCTASGGARSLLWVPAGDAAAAPAGVPAVTPAILAEEARSLLALPSPEVGVSPDGLNANPALVNLPTWWWVENARPLSQRTEVGPVWAEVTAQPVASSWVTSDGERTDCAGLGMAWAPGMAELEPGSCSHTYTRANAEEVAEVQVVWRVTWVGSGGASGTLEPFTIPGSVEVPVYERHAIVTYSG